VNWLPQTKLPKSIASRLVDLGIRWLISKGLAVISTAPIAQVVDLPITPTRPLAAHSLTAVTGAAPTADTQTPHTATGVNP